MFVLNVYTPKNKQLEPRHFPKPGKGNAYDFGWLQPLAFGYIWKMSLDHRLNLISIHFLHPRKVV